MGHLALVIKATRRCTLRCSYCTDWRVRGPQTMSFSVMVRMVASALGQREHQQVDFLWHGGEPILLPISFYEKALLVQSRLRRAGQRIGNSIQTNATRLTPAWARFFRANQIDVGVSLDGPPHLHNTHRRDPLGRESYQDVIRGLRLLKEHHVPFSVLVVVDDATLKFGAERLFSFLVNEGIHSFGLLAAKPPNHEDVVPGTSGAHYVKPALFSAFLLDLYDAWRRHGDWNIKIRELERLRMRISGQSEGFCVFSGECWGHYYMIEPNGDVVACDVFSGDRRYSLGNILTHDFTTLANGAALHRLKEEHRASLEAMKCCPEFAICKGWCPHEQYVSIRHNPRHRKDCCGLRELIVNIRNRMADEPDHLRSVSKRIRRTQL